MRNGGLSAQDFLKAAVVTSYPENQVVAYKIAWEILYGEEKQQEEEGEESPKKAATGGTVPAGAKKIGEEEPPDFGVGGGDELIMEWWFKFRREREYRLKLMEEAERTMLTAESKCEYTFLTKEDFGPLEGDKRRYFSPGDDPDYIDYEETIDELLSQGKGLSGIRYDDFVVKERKGQRKAVAILQDVSGSMSFALGHCLICTAMLLYALRKHEIALALFESNEYIIKRFFDRKPFEEVFDTILSARPMAGTMGGKTLKWGKEQLKKIDGRYYERECLIFSDFGFFDKAKVADEIMEIRNMDIKVIIILPPSFIYQSSLNNVLNRTDCAVIQLDKAKVAKFPEVIGAVI
jgi:hypothetical protein